MTDLRDGSASNPEGQESRRIAATTLLFLISLAFQFPASAHRSGAEDAAEWVQRFVMPLPYHGPGGAGVPPGASPAQPGHDWEGRAPAVPDTGLLNFDAHEFNADPNYKNDLLVVEIEWRVSFPGVTWDLDLYVDLWKGGHWAQVASSTGGQSLTSSGLAHELAVASSPSPGLYRARVTNWANAAADQGYSGHVRFYDMPDPPLSGSGTRSLVDRPDLTGSPKIHAIYFVPGDSPDEELDTNGTLGESVLAMNVWLDEQTPDRHFRLDTYLDSGATSVDVTFVRGLHTNFEYGWGDTFAEVTQELSWRGFSANPSSKRYLVFYAGWASSGACGTAYYPLGGGYAQWAMTFLDSDPSCGARDFGDASGPKFSEVISLQELLHNESLVDPRSPHHCAANLAHVCTAQVLSRLGNSDPESFDPMFPYVGRSLAKKVLDRGHDDYYNHPFPHGDWSDSPFLTQE